MPIKDPIKRKEYEKKWKSEHKELCRQWRNNWNQQNKDKKREMDREQRKKFPWKKHYDHAKQRCTNPNAHNYKWYGEKGINFELTLEEVKFLYLRYKAHDMKNPSIDRIDTYGNYTFENCRFIEMKENNKRPKRKSGRRAILQFDLLNVFLNEYVGVCDASRKTNVHSSNISQCLIGKQKTAGGFIWRYKNEV